MTPDLTVRLGEVTLAAPVLVASGCAPATGPGVEGLAAPGAVVTRSVTLDERAGTAPPRVVETASGVLVDTGLANPGLQGFMATELPPLVQRGVRPVVSIAGNSLGEFAELARRVGTAPGVAGVEVNLGWPDDTPTGRDPFQAGKVVAAVRRDLPRDVLVLAKVATAVDRAADVARAVADAGADAVVVGHGVPGLAIDPRTPRPGSVRGWSADPDPVERAEPGLRRGMLAGPAVHEVTLRCVWEVHRAVPALPVVGCGGVRDLGGLTAMLVAGATAVQVGSAVLFDPGLPGRLVSDLSDELTRCGLDGVSSLVGSAHEAPPGRDVRHHHSPRQGEHT
jgi:dihydroorotate dehydrogenase (NAD+) catalytic subunit